MGSKSKVNMPKELNKKCHAVIHSGTAAAVAGGAIPIPISDTVVITTAQIAMIVGLGKVFGITISESAAKSIAGCTITQQAGKAIFTNILKMIPGAGQLVGAFVGATTAGALTEALGWIIADDFYRMSTGLEPENIFENAGQLGQMFSDVNVKEKMPKNTIGSVKEKGKVSSNKKGTKSNRTEGK